MVSYSEAKANRSARFPPIVDENRRLHSLTRTLVQK
jgi:hypothetical protein